MFINTRTVLAGLLCLAFVACKKEDVGQNSITPKNNTGKTGISSTVHDSYYPFDNGNTYTYVDSLPGEVAAITKFTITLSGDTTLDGKVFSKTSTGGSSTFYNNSADGVTSHVAFKGKDKVTTTVLKANEPVAAVWKDDFSYEGNPATYEWKTVSKGMIKIVNEITYSNVIQVHLLGYANVPGQGKVLFADSDYYYAPNVGLIEQVVHNPNTGVTELHRTLQNFSVH